MLIINGLNLKTAIDWSGVESVSLDESEVPNSNLRVAMRSGGFFSVLNPTAYGDEVSFTLVMNAWLNNCTCWEVIENESKSLPAGVPKMIPTISF